MIVAASEKPGDVTFEQRGARKIVAVGLGRVTVEFHGTVDREAGALNALAEPPAS
jgi:hypothetical protein